MNLLNTLKNDQAKRGLPFENPLNDAVLDRISDMIEAMSEMPLNKKFDLNVEDFLFKPRGTIDIVIPEKAIEQNEGIKWKNISQTPPLNNTPQPVVNNMYKWHKKIQ